MADVVDVSVCDSGIGPVDPAADRSGDEVDTARSVVVPAHAASAKSAAVPTATRRVVRATAEQVENMTGIGATAEPRATTNAKKSSECWRGLDSDADTGARSANSTGDRATR